VPCKVNSLRIIPRSLAIIRSKGQFSPLFSKSASYATLLNLTNAHTPLPATYIKIYPKPSILVSAARLPLIAKFLMYLVITLDFLHKSLPALLTPLVEDNELVLLQEIYWQSLSLINFSIITTMLHQGVL